MRSIGEEPKKQKQKPKFIKYKPNRKYENFLVPIDNELKKLDKKIEKYGLKNIQRYLDTLENKLNKNDYDGAAKNLIENHINKHLDKYRSLSQSLENFRKKKIKISNDLSLRIRKRKILDNLSSRIISREKIKDNLGSRIIRKRKIVDNLGSRIRNRKILLDEPVPNIGVKVLKSTRYKKLGALPIPPPRTKKQAIKNKLNEWFHWLVDYVPENVKEIVSDSYNNLKKKYLEDV